MDPDFWLSRWREGRTAFHEGAPNALLTDHGARLGRSPKRVLVPLCGKTRDLAYLASLGHEVIGIELSPIAGEGFFTDSGLTPERSRRGPFEAFSAGGVTILVGDFFDTTPELLGPLDAAYDRAALVALPPALQERYARHVLSLLPTGAPILLVTFDYDTSKMQGPPFAIPSERVEALFGDRCTIEHLAERDVGDERPNFRAAGARELAWQLSTQKTSL